MSGLTGAWWFFYVGDIEHNWPWLVAGVLVASIVAWIRSKNKKEE